MGSGLGLIWAGALCRRSHHRSVALCSTGERHPKHLQRAALSILAAAVITGGGVDLGVPYQVPHGDQVNLGLE